MTIANKMESEGLPGKINVSEDTKKILENNKQQYYMFEFNKEVSIKSIKKKIPSYFIDIIS